MSSWSFRDLNLGGYETERPGGLRLQPGKHILRITEAKLRDMTSGNGKQLEVAFENEQGAGCRDFITVLHKTSDDAQRIGRQRLKALLTYAGHSNPDDPQDVGSLVGLNVGVIVEEEDAEITDRNTGEKKKIKAARVKKSGAYFPPNGAVPGARVPGSPKTPVDLDDEIPF